MLTRWGRELDPDRVLSEYPRPQLVRDSHLNLNGRWDYAITAEGDDPGDFDGTILVPFSPEAPLSGVGRQLLPDEVLWYRRTLALPPGFVPEGGRVLLHFGAVDQVCRVRLNGVEVGAHSGGYLPFTCDLTDALAPGENILVVEVRDASETTHRSRGKQRLDRGGIWYTAQSGIWQTVWCEAVPATYVARLDLVPRLDHADPAGHRLEVTVHGDGEDVARVRVLTGGEQVAEVTAVPGRRTPLPLPHARLWSPEDPFLYDVEVTRGDDRVTSYAALRSLGVGPDEHGTPRLLLNGAPYLQVGVLDQGYWPDGLLTAPSDEALVHDIATMKRLGFTMLRKHCKIEPLRWYHHCDRLGMLVWQDVPNGGERYRSSVTQLPGLRRGAALRLDDGRYSLFGRADAAGREEFRDEVRRTVALLLSVPSIAGWVPFNEGWGQFDARDVAEEVARLDPTRPVDHASGWHDQGAGDVRSLHRYGRPFRMPRKRDARAVVLSEYGGSGLRVDGHVWGDRSYDYGHQETAAALAAELVRLHDDEIGPAVRRGLAGTVYTQLSDVEDELNGLLTYDREVCKVDPALLRETLGRLRR